MTAFKVRRRVPAPFLALAFAGSDLAGTGAQEVNVVDVVVVIGDGFHLHVLGRVQELDLASGRIRPACRNDEVGLETGLLAKLAQDGLIRELPLVDMPAGRQP